MSSERSRVGAVRLAVGQRAYRLTEHAEREREADSILISEIEGAFSSDTVELLEDYQEDARGPSALFLAFTSDGAPLHAVIGLSVPEFAVLITVYRREEGLWYDWRRRA